MKARKIINLLILGILVVSIFLGGNRQAFAKTANAPGGAPAAAPASPVDETKVPHYFGPYSNYANSPFTLPDVSVTITDPTGSGYGAQANATIGTNGALTGINLTSPGSGYKQANVSIGGAGSGATASAAVNLSGAVTGVSITNGGGGYTRPAVSFSGGGGTGTLVQAGNTLKDRAYATDFVTAPSIVQASVSATSTRIYKVNIGSAAGGSFTLTVDAATTASIAWNAAAADVQSALALVGITATVSGSGSPVDPWVVVFANAPANVSIDPAGLTQSVNDASVTAGATPDTFSVTVGSASGGSFTLAVDSMATGAIAWNSAAADLQAALAAINVSATVTGSGSSVDPWVVVFGTAPASFTIDPAGLTQSAANAGVAAAPTDTYKVDVGSANGGSFTLTIDTVTTGAIAWNGLAADIQTALASAGITAAVSGSGSSADPWVIVFATAPASVTIDPAGLTQPSAPVTVPVFVVVPSPLPAGILKSFATWNQSVPGSSPTPSAGQVFNAYILRPVSGTTNQYQVVFDSGQQTVPALADPAVSAIASFPVADTAVQAGDVLAFYGAGIPVDIVSTGADLFSYPAPSAPAQGSTITLGDPATFPLFGQARTYSFAAEVLDTSTIVPLVNATGTVYGGVDNVILQNPGSGYTMPTVDFDLPDDPNGVQPKAHAEFDAVTGAITRIVVDSPGSGYSAAPNVVIRDGTVYAPINGGSGATAQATLAVQSVQLDTFGSGYVSAPSVSFSDLTGTGSGAQATASVSAGTIASVNLITAGSGYITKGGIKKFQDGLPVLCDPTAGWASCTDNNLGQHIPIAVPDTTTFTTANGHGPDADYYVIALVQHREQMSSSLSAKTLLREYVQLETAANASFSKHVLLQNDLLDGTSVPALMPDGSQAVAVDDPHYLGPVISATRDKPVRIVFYNLLPTGEGGNLFLPVDTSFMGSGMGPTPMAAPADQGSVLDGVRNPMCDVAGMKSMECYTDNRATLHLHGGVTPWISDGTPHQWITPAGENTSYPQGVTVSEVPDMKNVSGVPDCTSTRDGCMTFYYTNQQSARLMFYHDHSWGITRLNVYAGEAAGYVITDPTEQKMISSGLIPSDQIPLIIQDKTFVPSTQQLLQQDPTWDASRWGGEGNLWYEHVYMPAQNPGDPSGMSAFGRWMYGPWFWPPATPTHGPIANPYYNMDPKGPDGVRGTADDWSTPLVKPCNLDDPSTWQYQTDPFCEPAQIPGTPNNSAGMEQFNDTPLVNGTAYPTTSVQPKAYRLRILNAANDRFWNLQWYVADPTTGTDSEVALKASELAAAQTDPNVFPTPDTSISPAGPSWIQIGTEGGFLPAPAVIANQPITWITDPTRFDFGNVDKHSLLLAPAERADVIVDFSKYAGKTLILYNDAPAAFPARVASYDYYTGGPDLSPAGAPSTLPGYGPNTRTIMQVKVAASTPAAAFNLTALQNAFKHHADGSGVFESGQHPIIVGQAAYNSAYGTSFAASGACTSPTSTIKCDGFARINQQGGDPFTFDTLVGATSGKWSKLSIPLQPKALHDEMNAAAFDEFGRMTANLGLEAVPATPAAQNIVLYPYVNPSTELIDATNLPKGDLSVTAISSATDGTQIWKITHNGVDTHPIHFHLYDVQVLNRVTWDNIIMPPDPNELGWKDTVRISPLEDTIVALRPIIPTVPFEVPNSVRPLNPMMPIGDTSMFNNMDANGNPTTAITNQLVNFGWEYVVHCHILAHEEMDMMRPVSVALPPNAPDGLAWAITKGGLVLTWNDNSITETAFVVQKQAGTGAWTNIATILSPLDQPNTHGTRSYTDASFKLDKNVYSYRIVAQNTIGYGGQFMSLTAQSVSAPVSVVPAPSNLAATLQAGPQINLTWKDNAGNESGYMVVRSVNGGAFSTLINTLPANTQSFVDTTIAAGSTYAYQVAALSSAGPSAFSNTATVVVPAMPAAPTSFTVVNGASSGNQRSVNLSWAANTTNVTGFTIQRATNSAFTGNSVTSVNLAATATSYTWTGLSRNTAYYFRIRANNGAIIFSGWVNASPFPITTLP